MCGLLPLAAVAVGINTTSPAYSLASSLGPIPGLVAGWVIAATGIIVIGSLSETAITYGLLMFVLRNRCVMWPSA